MSDTTELDDVAAPVAGYMQRNLRMPVQLDQHLERLAAAEGKKVSKFILDALEDIVERDMGRLRKMYEQEAKRAMAAAHALDRTLDAKDAKNVKGRSRSSTG